MATYSTLAAARTAYLENADYQEEGSIAKAKTFVTACRALILFMPKRAMHGVGAGEIELDVRTVSEERKEAQRWLAAKKAGARVLYMEGS